MGKIGSSSLALCKSFAGGKHTFAINSFLWELVWEGGNFSRGEMYWNSRLGSFKNATWLPREMFCKSKCSNVDAFIIRMNDAGRPGPPWTGLLLLGACYFFKNDFLSLENINNYPVLVTVISCFLSSFCFLFWSMFQQTCYANSHWNCLVTKAQHRAAKDWKFVQELVKTKSYNKQTLELIIES